MGDGRVRRFGVTTRDPDEAHAHLRAMYSDHAVRLRGNREDFRFTHQIATGDGFSVARLHHTMGCQADVEEFDYLLVGQVISGELRVRSDSAEICSTPGEVFAFGSFERVSVQWDDIQAGLVRLEYRWLNQAAAELSDAEPPERVRFVIARAHSPERARHWQGLVRYLHHDLLGNGSAGAGPLIEAHAIRLLAAAALDTFPNDALAGAPVISGAAQASAVRRAMAFVDEHAGEAIGLTDIADAARLGPRSLQVAFRRHLDSTPTAYLRDVRLERAHLDLLVADPTAGVTVAQVARRWGFAHLGRFAARYRERYGDSPSRTIGR